MATAEITEADDETLPSSKPPFLRRVRIRGYKSIAFCDVMLEPLTVLVGRNGAGKSNFVDALAFVRDAIVFELPEAMDRHGGPVAIRGQLDQTHEVSVELDLQFIDVDESFRELDNALVSGTYKLVISYSGGAAFPKVHESFKVTSKDRGQASGFEASNGIATFDNEEPRPYPPNWLFLRAYGGTRVFGLKGALAHIRNHNFDTDIMRKPQLPSTLSFLDKIGSNLASRVGILESEDPATFHRIQAYLSAIVPEVTRFGRVPRGDYETVHFEMDTSRTKTRSLEFDAFSMSDGTLRVLATLIAAFPKSAILEGFVCFEEPETSLHPGAMNALVDALDEATLRNQVLITTHSAELLDNLTIKPQNVRVVQMIDGQTVIAPVDSASVEIVQENLNTLGGLERGNQLEPDFADLERQKVLSRTNGELHE